MMETTIQKTWRPTVAGILNIVSGVLSLLGAIGVMVGIVVVAAVGDAPYLEDVWWELQQVGIGLSFLVAILVIATVLSVIVGLLSLVGGVYALQRKKWGLALAGSIAAIFGSSFLGILATVLTAMSKDEFE